MKRPTFSFAEFVRVLMKNARMIIIFTLVVMIITAGISLFLPKIYKSTVTLLISESKMGIDGVLTNYFNPRFYYTFEGLVKNQELMKRAMNKFGLGEEPWKLKMEGFQEMVTVGLVRNTRLIKLSVEFPDPDMAAEIANFITAEAVQLNNEINQMDTEGATQFMKNQVETVRKLMTKHEEELKEYKKKAKIKELETDVETLLYTKADLKLRKLDAQVKKRELESMGKTQTEDEEDQPTVKQLDALIASLDKMIQDVEQELAQKQELLAERELRIEKLLTLFDADQTSYRRINTRYGENATRVSEKFQQIRIIDKALAPYYPEWPRKKLLVIIAGALAFIVSCGYALLREQLKQSAFEEKAVS